MSDFRDPDLENMLGRLSGAYPDDNVAYSAVAGRVRQVKRRRAFVATTAACVALVGVGVLAVQGGGQGEHLQPASELSDDSSSTESTQSTVSTIVLSVPSSVDDKNATESSVDNSTSGSTATSVTTASNNSGPGTSSGRNTTTSGATTTSGSSGSNSGTSNTSAAPADQTMPFTSDGGSIQVKVTNGSLSLVSSTPADGYTVTVKHDRGDRVEVEFSGNSGTWRIRIDLNHGVITSEITAH